MSVRQMIFILLMCFQANSLANVNDDPLTLKAVMQLLAKRNYSPVRFVEHKTSALLTRDIQLEGILNFRPPAYLVKHVLKPYEETFELKQGAVYYTKTDGDARKLELQEYPVLSMFVSAYTSLLAGRLDLLKRDFKVMFNSRQYGWRIQLLPHDITMREYVRELRFNGAGDTVMSIVSIEADGDTTTTRLLPGEIVQHP